MQSRSAAGRVSRYHVHAAAAQKQVDFCRTVQERRRRQEIPARVWIHIACVSTGVK